MAHIKQMEQDIAALQNEMAGIKAELASLKKKYEGRPKKYGAATAEKIAQLLAQGKSIRNIAAELGISTYTVQRLKPGKTNNH